MDTPQLSNFTALSIETGAIHALGHLTYEMTVFAPLDTAFAALAGDDAVDTLSANIAALEAVIKLHIVDGAFSAADLYDGQLLRTAAGVDLTVARLGDTIDILAPGDEGTVARIAIADVAACGSVVHMVDTVLVPDADVVVDAAPRPTPRAAKTPVELVPEVPVEHPLVHAEPAALEDPTGAQLIASRVLAVLSGHLRGQVSVCRH